MAVGSLVLSMPAASVGSAGYIVPMVAVTVGYALFQTANNTAVMSDVRSDQRGVISGMRSLSRNLGLITGASMMGAVFARGAATDNLVTAHPEAVAGGMRNTFGLATALIAIAIALSAARRPVQKPLV